MDATLPSSFEWTAPLTPAACAFLQEAVLPNYLRRSRWFGGKALRMRGARVIDQAVVDSTTLLLFLEVEYEDGDPQVYLLPVTSEGHNHHLADASLAESFRRSLADLISGRCKWQSEKGQIVSELGTAMRGEDLSDLPSRVLGVEQSNTSIIFGNRFFCKLFRKIEDGENPDVEITRYLTEKQAFPHVPPFVAALRHERIGQPLQVLGLVQLLIPNEGDAWAWTLNSLSRYYDRILEGHEAGLGDDTYAEQAALLGRRTGELHNALASSEDAGFAPEPFSFSDQESLHRSMRETTLHSLDLLRSGLTRLPAEVRHLAEYVLDQESEILAIQARVAGERFDATRIRVHGDYHLGQVLFTGQDFVIIDFEGEPARSLSERRTKQSPLKDVAGMLRSFHYAAHSALLQRDNAEELPILQPWAERWSEHMGRRFLAAYLETTGMGSPDNTQILLEAFLLEKATYEIAYELNNRPDWLFIPLKGIERILA